MTSAAKAKVLNDICFLRITQGTELAETPRWLNTLETISQTYPFWQRDEMLPIQLSAEDPVSEMYAEILEHRSYLRSLAEQCEVPWAEASEGLF